MFFEGVKLMILGMSVVLVFLALMVIAMMLMATIFKQETPAAAAPAPAPQAPPAPAAPQATGEDNGLMVAAMMAGIARYRAEHKK